MKEFKDIKFNPHPNWDGIQGHIFFENKFGVSVIKSSQSYGGMENLYELAILVGDDSNYELCYDTEITDDVIGYLTEEKITDYMALAQKLEITSLIRNNFKEILGEYNGKLD